MSDGKRKKNYYSGQINKKANYKYRINLDSGMKGFFTTCNFCEKDLVRDAYKILNEYWEKNKNSDVDITKAESKTSETDIDNSKSNVDEDILVSVQNEICNLKASSNNMFQSVDTGIKNIIFIKSNVPDPLKLVEQIMKDAFETKIRKTRFILRLLPVEIVCKAYIDVIKSKADSLFDNYFVKEPKTFAIVFNRHSSNSVQRNEVINELADLISKKNPGNKVDLKNPQLTVIVEIIRSFCLLSIVPNYFLYKKYNLTELCGSDSKKEQKMEQNEVENEKKEKIKQDEEMNQEVTKDEGIKPESEIADAKNNLSVDEEEVNKEEEQDSPTINANE